MALEDGFRADVGKLRLHADIISEELRLAWALEEQISLLDSYAQSLGSGSVRPIRAQASRLSAYFRGMRDCVESMGDDLEHFSAVVSGMLEDARADARASFRALNTTDFR